MEPTESVWPSTRINSPGDVRTAAASSFSACVAAGDKACLPDANASPVRLNTAWRVRFTPKDRRGPCNQVPSGNPTSSWYW